MPATWEAPFEAARVVPLKRGSVSPNPNPNPNTNPSASPIPNPRPNPNPSPNPNQAEYDRVERLALAQQFRPGRTSAPYVKGKLKVRVVRVRVRARVS